MEKPLQETRNEESITELGNPRKPEGDWGAEMLSRMNQSHADLTAWGLSFLDLRPDDFVLDIGCGGGAALARMAETVTNGHLTGIDYSPVSVEQSKNYNREWLKEGRMDICLGNVSQLPFADQSFDKIITIESFYFWSDPPADLREVRRVLRRGGKFLLIADICGGADLTETEQMNIQKYQLYNPSPVEFEQLLRQAGFSPVTVHLYGAEKAWICAEGCA